MDNKLLSKLITDSRQLIVKLYSTCETDFFKGLQIFEALVEKQILDTSVAQIEKLKKNVEETISIDDSSVTPESVSSAIGSTSSPSVPPPPEAAAPPSAAAAPPSAATEPTAAAAAAEPTKAAAAAEPTGVGI